MKFLCLICAEKVLEQMPEETAARHMSDYETFTRETRAGGHYVTGHRLLPSATAVTVRVRDGKVSTTDGPFAETKEQLGGYILIEAADRDEAVAIAARIPGAWRGCVEVREVADDARTRQALGLAPADEAR